MAKEIKTLSDLTPDNKNFNKGTEHGGRLLGDSISRFGCGRSILVDKDGNIIAGNKTAEKCAELGIEKVRVVETSGDELVVVKRTDIELDSDRGREMALADNVTSLKDLDLDLELIEDCLGDDVLDRWGLKIDEKHPKIETQDFVEEMLNECMQRNLQELLLQIDILKETGSWIMSGLTQGMVEAKFIRCKYYNERFPQYLSMYYNLDRFYTTSNNQRSLYEQMKYSAEIGKGGIAGFRTKSKDGNVLTNLISSSYHIGGATLPLDFPSVLFRDYIKEFCCEKRPEILDPCHGWGGV